MGFFSTVENFCDAINEQIKQYQSDQQKEESTQTQPEQQKEEQKPSGFVFQDGNNVAISPILITPGYSDIDYASDFIKNDATVKELGLNITSIVPEGSSTFNVTIDNKESYRFDIINNQIYVQCPLKNPFVDFIYNKSFNYIATPLASPEGKTIVTTENYMLDPDTITSDNGKYMIFRTMETELNPVA